MIIILIIILKVNSFFCTANFPLDVVKRLPEDFATGIYFGWASVDEGEVLKMVMSIGWNPYFHNKEKSMVSEIDFDDFIQLT